MTLSHSRRLELKRELRVEPVIVVRSRHELRSETNRESARVHVDEESQDEAKDIDADAPRLDALHDTRGDAVLHSDLLLHACHDTRVISSYKGEEAK